MQKTKTLEQQAYEKIKTKIQKGLYKPGMHLTEALLVEDLQMSRTPIRRALGRLENEKLLLHHSHQGNVVQNVKISMINIINMFEVHKAFLISSLDKAKRKQLKFDIKSLNDCVETIEWAFRDNNVAVYYETVNRIHNLIVGVSNNQLMMDVINESWERFTFHSSQEVFELRKSGVNDIIKGYKEAVAALESQDYDKVNGLLEKMYQEILRDLLY